MVHNGRQVKHCGKFKKINLRRNYITDTAKDADIKIVQISISEMSTNYKPSPLGPEDLVETVSRLITLSYLEPNMKLPTTRLCYVCRM